MTTLFSTLKTTARVAARALALGAIALTAAPALAEGPGSNLTLDMGGKAGETGMTTMMAPQTGVTFEAQDFDF